MWDADLRWSGDGWSYHSFRGAKRDKTRSPGFYEGVSQYLADLGVPVG